MRVPRWLSARRLAVAVGAVALSCAGAACKGASGHASTAADASSAPAAPLDAKRAAHHKPAVAEQPAPVAIPADCDHKDGDFCLPPKPFVDKLCEGSQPNVALTMFRKGTPWTRVYVRRPEMEAWYAGGGGHSHPAKLHFAEELLVVFVREGKAGGMQVSGSGSYDVFRWDGSCVSLMSDEIALHAPSNPDTAPIPWKQLDEDMQQTLLKDKRITYRNDTWVKSCKETGPGSDQRCERALVGMSRMIGDYLRAGGELPDRKSLP